MTLEKFRGLSDDELRAQLVQSAEQLFRIRFQKSMGNLEGVKKLRTHKLEIAQVKTLQREREISVELEARPIQKNPAPAPSQRTAKKKKQKA